MGITSMFKKMDDLKREYMEVRSYVKNSDGNGLLDEYEKAKGNEKRPFDQYIGDYNSIEGIFENAYNNGSKRKVIEAIDKMEKLYAKLLKYGRQLKKLTKEYNILSESVFNNSGNGVLNKLGKISEFYEEYKTAFDKINGKINRVNLYSIKEAIKKMQRLKGEIENCIVRAKGVGDLADDALNENADQDPLISRIKNKEKLDKKELEFIENKVKSYVKSKIGSFEFFKSKLKKFAEEYKGENEYIPIEDMREIYGTKGALMMICNLENGKIMKRKMFSTYRRVCDRILKNYRSLKVEAVLAAVKSESLNSKFDVKDVSEINTMLYKLGILKDEVSVKQNQKFVSLLNKSRFESKYGISSDDKVFSFWENIADSEKLISRLKNVEGNSNKERKEMINRVLRRLREIKASGTEGVEEVFKRKGYLKEYNAFIENSSDLALHYLKKEGMRKLKRLVATSREGLAVTISSEQDYNMDTFKIALMCLVAVCSKEKSKISEGKRFFKYNEEFLKEALT